MQKVIYIVIVVTFFLFALFLGAGYFLTQKFVDSEIALMKDSLPHNRASFIIDSINVLPELLNKYLDYTIATDTLVPEMLEIKETGLIRTGEKAGWKNFAGKTFFTSRQPEFISDIDIEASGLLGARAIETYLKGKGKRVVKILGGLTITNAEGEYMDRNSLINWISLLPLAPHTFLSFKNIHWKKADSTSLNMKFITAADTLRFVVSFDSLNTLTSITTPDAYKTTSKGFMPGKQRFIYSNYKKSGNHLVPRLITSQWVYPDSVFTISKKQIEEVDYIY